MKTSYKNCQSCSMPLRKDPRGGGTESDGSKSVKFCSYCYRDGRFTRPEMTSEQMQTFVKTKVRELGFPGFLAGLFARRIPKLDRWRSR